MKRLTVLFLMILFLAASLGEAGFLDNFMKGIGPSKGEELDDNTTISGLKEALLVGTENAVSKVSKIDGYLANEAIKIMLPENIRKVADVLKKVGYEKYVNDFVTSMNRAAEKAAPAAVSHFTTAIKDMSFEDAKGILNGSDNAATEYFRAKTSDDLYEELKPIVSLTMNEVGVTKSYKAMMRKYTSLPLMKEESFDLDHYVTEKTLDGLFYMIAEEEKKIRTDPAARVTDLLKQVFGK
jgi:hypothetical protein